MCFIAHIIFMNFVCINRKQARHRPTCLAPEIFKKSISCPWPRKVVHNWSREKLLVQKTGSSNSGQGKNLSRNSFSTHSRIMSTPTVSSNEYGNEYSHHALSVGS